MVDDTALEQELFEIGYGQALILDRSFPLPPFGIGVERVSVDLAEEVHRCWPNVLLLVTSGGVVLRDEDLPDHGRFIPKPYRASTLISQVRQLIAQSRGR